MRSRNQILLMVVLAALVMRGPANVVGPMAPVVREVFGLSWDAFGVLAGIPTMAFGLCSLAVLPPVARFGSRTFAVLALAGVVFGLLSDVRMGARLYRTLILELFPDRRPGNVRVKPPRQPRRASHSFCSARLSWRCSRRYGLGGGDDAVRPGLGGLRRRFPVRMRSTP